MKPSLFLFTIATLALGGCASHLSSKIHNLNVAKGTAKPTAVIAPPQETNFADFAARQSPFVEQELGNSTANAIAKFGRFSSVPGRGADATVMFDSIRHGVTRVSNNLYAPIVEANVRVVGENGKILLRRHQSATSGEIHPLEEFVRNSALYREAIDIASEKLGIEIASDL
jgi:hypothetical protein